MEKKNNKKEASVSGCVKSAVIAVLLLPVGLFILFAALGALIEKSYLTFVLLLALGAAAMFFGISSLRRLVSDKKALKHPVKDAQETPAEKSVRTHGNMTFKVAGVTFENEDGKSRQALLKKAYSADCMGTVTFEEYKYRGKPAVKVLYDGSAIGNVPADKVREFLDVSDRITYVDLDIQKFTPEDDDDWDDDDSRRGREVIYYGNVFIKYKLALD